MGLRFVASRRPLTCGYVEGGGGSRPTMVSQGLPRRRPRSQDRTSGERVPRQGWRAATDISRGPLSPSARGCPLAGRRSDGNLQRLSTTKSDGWRLRLLPDLADERILRTVGRPPLLRHTSRRFTARMATGAAAAAQSAYTVQAAVFDAGSRSWVRRIARPRGGTRRCAAVTVRLPPTRRICGQQDRQHNEDDGGTDDAARAVPCHATDGEADPSTTTWLAMSVNASNRAELRKFACWDAA